MCLLAGLIYIFIVLCFLTEAAAGSSNQVDLFGDSLVGDLLDAPTPVPTANPAVNSSSSEVDLFADATFVSASPHVDKAPGSQTQVRYSVISIYRNTVLYFK